MATVTKARDTGLTSADLDEIRRLSRGGPATVFLRGREFFTAGPYSGTADPLGPAIREIVDWEVIREDPEWRWAAHAIHSSEWILTVRAINDPGWLDGPVYADGVSYYARTRRNTRWVGETPEDRIRGPYGSQDEALATLVVS